MARRGLGSAASLVISLSFELALRRARVHMCAAARPWASLARPELPCSNAETLTKCSHVKRKTGRCKRSGAGRPCSARCARAQWPCACAGCSELQLETEPRACIWKTCPHRCLRGMRRRAAAYAQPSELCCVTTRTCVCRDPLEIKNFRGLL